MALAAIYLLFSVINYLYFEPPFHRFLPIISISTAFVLIVVARYMPFSRLTSNWLHPYIVLLYCAAMLNAGAQFYWLQDLSQTINFVLILIGCGFVMRSYKWMTLVTVMTFVVWTVLMYQLPAGIEWPFYCASLFAGTLVAFYIHFYWQRVLQQQVKLHYRNRRQRRDLEVALSAAQEAHEMAEASRQDLADAMAVAAKSEQRFRRLSELTSEGIFVLNKLRIADCNAAAQHLFGLRYPEALQTEFPSLVQTAFREFVAESLRKGEQTVRDILCLRNDGSVFPAELAIRSLQESGIGHQVLVVRDLSLQRGKAREAQDSLRLYRQIFEEHRVPKLIVDPDDGRIVAANQAAEIFFGIPDQELQRTNLAQLGSLTNEELILQLKRSLEQNESVLRLTHVSVNGGRRELEMYTSPIVYDERDLLYAILHDVTQRVHAEQRLASVFEITASVAGEAFFEKLTRSLSELFDVRACMMAEFSQGGEQEIRVRAMQIGGEPRQPFELDLQDSVFLRLHDENEIIHRDGLGHKFPMDDFVQQHGFNSLCALALCGTDGTRIGFLAILHDGKLSAEQSNDPVLRVFAARAAIELQRAHAERALRESAAQLDTLVSNTPVVLFALNAEGRFTLSRGRGLQNLGLEQDEVVGVSCFELYADVPEIISMLNRAYKGESARGIVTVKGNEFEYWCQPVRRKSGEIDGVIGVATDVSARQRAERELKRREAYYRTLIEHALDGIVILSEQSRVRFASEPIEKILGYSPNALVGRSFFDFIHPEDISEFRFAVQRIGADSHIFTAVECRICHRSGAWKTMEGTLRFFNADLHETGFVFNFRDVTERKHAEKALMASEYRYRQLFNDNITANFLCSEEGYILSCNRTFLQYFGFKTEEQAIGTSLRERFRYPAKFDKMLDQLQKQDSVEQEESQFLRTNGSVFFAIENLVGEFDDEGRLKEIRGVLFEITQRKELEQELSHSQKMEAIGKLAGGVAHDFNNLLTAINGYCEILKKNMPTEKNARIQVEEIIRSVQWGGRMTRQLLAFGRKQVFDLKVFDLNEVIREMREMLNRMLTDNVRLDTFLDKKPLLIEADSDQLKNVLLNLVVNSREAMPDGGTIEISTGYRSFGRRRKSHIAGIGKGEYAYIRIKDSGVGMEETMSRRIFEPYFTTKEKDLSSGLGLASVYGIIKQSKGGIDVESQPNAGTTMHVYLPIVRRPQEQQHAKSAHEQDSHRGKGSLILVEDNAPVREVTSDMLKDLGYEVLEAENGEHALRVVESLAEIPQLLITDMIMPGMTGLELARTLIEKSSALKVLIVSGYVDDKLQDEEAMTQKVQFLQKPFTSESLAERLQALTSDVGEVS